MTKRFKKLLSALCIIALLVSSIATVLANGDPEAELPVAQEPAAETNVTENTETAAAPATAEEAPAQETAPAAAEEDPVLSRSDQGADLPAPLSSYTLQRPVPSGRGSSTAPSPRRSPWKSRNIDRVSHRHRRSA